MKFANISYKSKGVDNLGDNMQVIALDYIYSSLGVTDIIHIDKSELQTYSGEMVILPVIMPLLDYCENGLAGYFSKNITPIFLALTLVKDILEPVEVEFLIQYQPIGCRDERTKKTLRRYGIEAYLTGCITATLPKRQNTMKNTKTFLVDIDTDVIDLLPDRLKNNCEIITHTRQNSADPKNDMKQLYNRYLNEGECVVTSLLHCAVPCIAAGIPVIIARRDISYRFGWLEKLLPVYRHDEWADINWNIDPVEYEDHKIDLFDFYKYRLIGDKRFVPVMRRIDEYYSQRKASEYVNDAIDPIIKKIDDKFKNKSNPINFSFWGMSQISEQIYHYIKREFPGSQLVGIYDSFRKLSYKGLISKHPENMSCDIDELVIVTSFSGGNAAKVFFESRPEKDYLIAWER